MVTCPLLLMETGPAFRVKDTPLLDTFMLVFLSSFLVLRKLNPTVVPFLEVLLLLGSNYIRLSGVCNSFHCLFCCHWVAWLTLKAPILVPEEE
jgi:hypothetical protein